LGEWKKDILYNNLSHYGNLILLSDGEADPLVVKEALICGLGVVVSECASANLDLSKDFITVIPNNKLTDLKYVENAINANRLISIERRDEIRDYGLRIFSWKSIIHKYNQIISKSS
jgi:glycosyltransferase involved in cell wall biosynthesis